MLTPLLHRVIDGSAFRNRVMQRSSPRRSRNRVTPIGESLESRVCLSEITPSSVPDRLAHVARVSSLANISKGGPTVRVKPGAKSGARSLATALKLAKPGETIVLAPGIYTQNAVIKKKSDITIIGAPNQSSILEPVNGDAIKVMMSSGITIQNVWFRSEGSQGRGLSVMGSTVSVQNIKTDGTQGDGAYVVEYNGQSASLNATSSQFDQVQTGDGLDLRQGSSATINSCTFNDDGTAPNVSQSSVGLVLAGNASATIVDSEFVGNTNAGLVALQSSQVTAEGSTFSDSRKGDGALFLNQASVNLTGDTFASNGQITGLATGFNGVEFMTNFTGTAAVTGNLFQNNTASGVWVGSAPNTIEIADNTFDGNVAGVFLDASVATINATVRGNTFVVPIGSPDNDVGFLAIGSGVTATIGGDGALANTIENYANGNFIDQLNVSDGETVGYPDDTILSNTFLRDGVAIPPSQAITTPG